MENKDIQKGKTPAIISYILIIGPLIALSMNSGEEKTKYASFHIRQGLGLTVTFISLGLILNSVSIPMATVGMWGFISILCIYGLFVASQGEEKVVPIVGNLFQKIFKNL